MLSLVYDMKKLNHIRHKDICKDLLLEVVIFKEKNTKSLFSDP